MAWHDLVSQTGVCDIQNFSGFDFKKPGWLPGMAHFGVAPVGPTVAGTANPKSRNRILDTVS